jgi:DNA ligase-associated metallophosphoesterase
VPISPEAAPSRTAIPFAGETLWLDASGAVYWPAQDLLAVADLHFEKASYLARSGHPLPPYDTRDSLATLAGAVATYQPRRLVLLGDSFHDPRALARMAESDRAVLAEITGRVETCLWIEGNHEGTGFLPPGGIGVAEHRIGGLAFRHQPDPADAAAQLVGHFHPKATLRRSGHRIRGRCFLVSRTLLILPAFGSFTGGLDSADAAFTAVFGGEEPRVFLCYRDSIHPLAPSKSATGTRSFRS